MHPVLSTTRSACLAVLVLAGIARAGVPTDQVRDATDKVIAIAADPGLKGPAKLADRRAKMRDVIAPRFAWEALAKGVLGANWEGRSEAERTEFIALFRTLLERTYMKKIEGYAGEKVKYGDETVTGTSATVKTLIITTQQTEVPLDYRLVNADGQWQVTDVFIEGVSLLDNYKAQFAEQLQQGGFKELLQALKKKTAVKER